MPTFTVTLGSNRPGGVDVALAGLAHQTFKDFEVVFVDGLYEWRHAEVLDAVKASGLEQPFYHVPNHRSRPGIWGTTCAGYNTGFALAGGEFVVMLLDYAYAPPRWLEEHARHQAAGRKIILGPHEYRTLAVGDLDLAGNEPPIYFDRTFADGHHHEIVIQAILAQRARFGKISCFKRPFTPGDLAKFPVEASDAKCIMPTGPWKDENYFNTKNESFPLRNVLEANGMDENYDKGRGPGDPDLCHRLVQTGLGMWIVNESIVHSLNPRFLLPNMNIVIPETGRLPPPYDHRWYIKDGYKYFATTLGFENVAAPNPFDIGRLRKSIWGWREASLEKKPVLKSMIIDDAEYYERENY